ncbi:MAG: tRNA pseudouridine synthase tRNA pseudouridine55 synthase [Candidatus Parcubacteria bacterium]|jgi:tRNA pseudouridine(55) synthase
MIEFYKKRGETPLEALKRLRVEHPKFVTETLSYAGRLDPIAEGILPVLVGEEENKNRKEFLNKDKEYQATFLIGCSSDTGDVLGVLQNVDFGKVEEGNIEQTIKSLNTITEQTYPWYSSKTVDSIPLFEYARKGSTDITRPTRDIKIYSVGDIKIFEVELHALVYEIIEDIKKVRGDFRQEEIITKWKELISHPELVLGPRNKTTRSRVKPGMTCVLVSCLLNVSSGTYIRALTENIEQAIGRPVLLYKLIRTKVL